MMSWLGAHDCKADWDMKGWGQCGVQEQTSRGEQDLVSGYFTHSRVYKRGFPKLFWWNHPGLGMSVWTRQLDWNLWA